MFRATSCSSSGESIVSIQRLVYVNLCRWPSGLQVWQFLPDLHTIRPLTQSNIYQTLYWYNWFSWWRARGCSKRVEDWYKHIRKKELCVKLVIYQNYTEMHGKQNIKTCVERLRVSYASTSWNHTYSKKQKLQRQILFSLILSIFSVDVSNL
jgi:hypothetical protein